MQRLCTVSKQFLGAQLYELGFVAMDPLVPKAVREQQPFVAKHPNANVSRSIEQIAGKLLEIGDNTISNSPMNFFERFLVQYR